VESSQTTLNCNAHNLTKTLFEKKSEVPAESVLATKIKNILNEMGISDGVYNGKRTGNW
jgi:hypothetical protein